MRKLKIGQKVLSRRWTTLGDSIIRPTVVKSFMGTGLFVADDNIISRIAAIVVLDPTPVEIEYYEKT